MNKLLNDADIGSSLDPVKVIEKTLKKNNVDIICLLFIILQEDEIESKVEVMVKIFHALQVSFGILNHNINSFSNL